MKEYCDTSKLSVRKISKSVAKDVIVKNHYSHLWTKVSYSLGLYIEDDSHQFFDASDKLIGVICYGDPIGRLSGQSLSPLLDRTEVLELVRVFVFDDYGSNIESWFLGQSFKWLKKNGGLTNQKKVNESKSTKLYSFIDGNDFYFNDVDKNSRSIMNVPFLLKDDSLNSKFLSESEDAGLLNLAGHRSVGGMRASIYNGVSEEAVDALIDFMKLFAEKNG